MRGVSDAVESRVSAALFFSGLDHGFAQVSARKLARSVFGLLK